MTFCTLIAFVAIAFPTTLNSYAQTAGGSGLDQVLRQMESVGKTFVSFKAHFTWKKYTAVLKEFDEADAGEFYYARARDGSALLRKEVTKPGRNTLTIKGGTAILYQPGLNQASVVNLGKNKDKVEYLALGLGQSPGKLRESFDISYQGLRECRRRSLLGPDPEAQESKRSRLLLGDIALDKEVQRRPHSTKTARAQRRLPAGKFHRGKTKRRSAFGPLRTAVAQRRGDPQNPIAGNQIPGEPLRCGFGSSFRV